MQISGLRANTLGLITTKLSLRFHGGLFKLVQNSLVAYYKVLKCSLKFIAWHLTHLLPCYFTFPSCTFKSKGWCYLCHLSICSCSLYSHNEYRENITDSILDYIRWQNVTMMCLRSLIRKRCERLLPAFQSWVTGSERVKTDHALVVTVSLSLKTEGTCIYKWIQNKWMKRIKTHSVVNWKCSRRDQRQNEDKVWQLIMNDCIKLPCVCLNSGLLTWSEL